MTDKRCPTCRKNNRLMVWPHECDDAFHDEPTQGSDMERDLTLVHADMCDCNHAGLRERNCVEVRDILRKLIAAERADAVKGMHVAMCACHSFADFADDDSGVCYLDCPANTSEMCHPYTDPRCIAARKEAEGVKHN